MGRLSGIQLRTRYAACEGGEAMPFAGEAKTTPEQDMIQGKVGTGSYA